MANALKPPPLRALVHEIIEFHQASGKPPRDARGQELLCWADALLDSEKGEPDFHAWLIAFAMHNKDREFTDEAAGALVERAWNAVKNPPGRTSRRQREEGRQRG